MFFNNHSRRNFIRLLGGLGGLTFTGTWVNAQPSSRLTVIKTISGVRIVATVTSTADLWRLQKSIDQGKTWVMLVDKPIISQGRLVWNLPMPVNEPVGKFRLKLVTEATMEVADATYQISANGESLFTAMQNKASQLATLDSELYDWGRLVTEIKGKRRGDGLHWFLYVNGQMPKSGPNSLLGCSDYIPQPGDQIKWELENRNT